MLAPWYTRRSVAPHAHGCAATSRWRAPTETLPNLTIAPSSAAATVDDMIRDVKHGIYLTGGGGAGGDFGLLTAYGGASRTQEIRNGTLVGDLKDAGIQFAVRSFWQGLVAIGGPSSVATFVQGNAGLFECRTVRAVPAHFREVNVVNTGRTR
jgi:TldD protein